MERFYGKYSYDPWSAFLLRKRARFIRDDHKACYEAFNGKNEIIYLLYDFQRDGDEYVLKFGIMPPSTVRNIVPNSETTYSVPSYDSFFYETVNKKMKYMKHDENATKISAHIYKVGHEKCKDICDKNYRMELVEIESPYEIRSESLMELVSMFIEDATRFPTIVL